MFCTKVIDVLQKMFNILLLGKSVVYRRVLAFTLWVNGYMCIKFSILKIDFAALFRFNLLGSKQEHDRNKIIWICTKNL